MYSLLFRFTLLLLSSYYFVFVSPCSCVFFSYRFYNSSFILFVSLFIELNLLFLVVLFFHSFVFNYTSGLDSRPFNVSTMNAPSDVPNCSYSPLDSRVIEGYTWNLVDSRWGWSTAFGSRLGLCARTAIPPATCRGSVCLRWWESLGTNPENMLSHELAVRIDKTHN